MVSRPTPDDRVEVEYLDGSRKRVKRARLADLGPRWRVVAEEPPAPPPASAVKADWVAHAVALGADEAEAQAETKAALVEKYGPKDEPGDGPGEHDDAPEEG